VVQGFAQPFHCVQSPGKRGRDVFQDDAIGCAKRAHGNLAFANQERENMSPLHFLGGPGHAHAAAQQMQNRGGHPAFQNHQAAWMHGDQGMGAAQLGGSVGVCGAAQSEGMDEAMMDTGVQSALCPSSPARFQRFPSNGSTCPTYYHQAVSAVSRVDPQVAWWSGGGGSMDAAMTCKESVAAVAAPQWQFGPEAPGNPYGGKSDYY